MNKKIIPTIQSVDDQTIIAQCTPQGNGSLALLRITGTDAITITQKIAKLASSKKLTELPTHTIHFGWVIDENKNHIDQVLFMLMRSPQTFTGQNTVEITCHNNPFIIEAIIQQAIKYGARLASNGEFTKRAVLNNKIDLVQAEAINELIHAQTEYALKQALAQLDGSLSSWIADIEKKLVKALAFSEASFEFIDEEDMTFGSYIKETINTVLQTIETIKKTYNHQEQIRQGIRVALIGSVNAGKSSLFNNLINKERAIVTQIAGTTRDSIEAGMYQNGNFVTFVDTAGLRQTDDIVEQKGIDRSIYEAERADIVLLVIDNSKELSPQEIGIYKKLYAQFNNKILIVYTKSDLDTPRKQSLSFLQNEGNYVSNITKHNLDLLTTKIQERIARLYNDIASPFLLNKRQYKLLLKLEKTLMDLLPMLEGTIQYELVSIHINDALKEISELTGHHISQMAMDKVFREFCVGK